MRWSLLPVCVLMLALGAGESAAQNAALGRAQKAYDDLRYDEAVAQARRALRERMSAAEQEQAYEILGFAYAALDSARQATEAFKEVILLNPDQELDPGRISPKITSAFSLALGQVLVIRQFDVDTTSFVAGKMSAPFKFTVTRTARLNTKLRGPAGDLVLDASLGEGLKRVEWNGFLANGTTPKTGSYKLVVEASAGRDRYAASYPLWITANPVDTMPHLATLPGYQMLPEKIVPPRNWRPFGIALIASAVVAGGSLALENSQLGGSRDQLLAVSAGTAVIGLLSTLKRPAPVPAPANIRYNELVREQLAKRNAEIAADNAERRRQTRLSVRHMPREEKAQ